MKGSEQTCRLARFGPFELDTSTGEVRREGRRVRLQEQPLRILNALIQRPLELVTRDELRNALWPPDTFVDFDHGISKAISKLRDALGDSAEAPLFVQTVGRRGYRFIAHLEWRDGWNKGATESPVLSVAPAPAENHAAIVQPPRPARRWKLIAATAGIGIALAAVWFTLQRAESHGFSATVTPVTSFPGQKNHAALSPDGNSIVVAWDGGSGRNLDLYLKLVDASQPLRLTDTPDDEYAPVWSSDGRQIAFVRRSAERAAVYVMPSLGGPERKLSDIYPTRIEDVSLDWSPDQQFLAVTDRDADASLQAIFLVFVESGEKRRLTTPSGQHVEDVMPRFSRDGSAVAFARGATFLVRDIYIVRIAGGEPRRVTSHASMVRGLAWSSDGHDIIFSSNRGGLFRLWRVPSGGGDPRPVPEAGGDATFPSVSWRGRNMTYVVWRQDANIWRTVGPLSTIQNRSPEKFIASTRSEARPSYSPDGSRIVFSSDRSGTTQLWTCDSNGDHALQLTTSSGASPIWSPDGTRIAYDALTDAHSDIFVISATGGTPRRITVDPSQDNLPSWSNDGRWIYFASNRTGTNQIWKVSAEGGEARQVTQRGGFQAFESSDGRFLYYDKARGLASIWRMPVAGGEEVRILDDVDGGYWSLMKGGICFLNRKGWQGPAIEFFDFAIGRRTWQIPVEKEELTPGPVGFSVSPDGQWVLYKRLDHVDNDIMLVENFR